MSYREGIDTTPGGFPYRQAPHGYCGSNSDRQSVGDPGHCEDCCSVGHIVAHPDLGCADVGCYSDHVDEPVSVSPDPPGLPPVCATCGNPITHTGAGYRHVNPILNVLTEHEATPEEGAQVAREQTTVHTNTSVTGITDEMIELGAQAIAEEIGMRGQLYPVESPDFPAHRRRVAEASLRGALARRAVVDQPELIETPKFQGCTNSNPDLCACSEDASMCVACGGEIEDGARAYTVHVPDYPFLPVDHPEQEWSDLFWHETCDCRTAVPPSGVAGGGAR